MAGCAHTSFQVLVAAGQQRSRHFHPGQIGFNHGSKGQALRTEGCAYKFYVRSAERETPYEGYESHFMVTKVSNFPLYI